MSTELSFKVIVIGDSTVGKTSLLNRYINNKFIENMKTTVGVDYAVKKVQWTDNLKVRLSFFDIVGQERSRILSRTYYKGAAGCFVMFDVTNRGTLEGAQTWKKDLDEKVILPSGSPVPSVLLANKCDLLHQRAISEEEIATFAQNNNFIGWKEISVKENRNIPEAMKILIDKMLQLDEQRDVLQQAVDKKYHELQVKNQPSANSGCSC